MRQKEIDAIPVGKTRKKGKIIRHVKSEKSGDLLILDLFVDKEYVGRYVQDVRTGEYAARRKDTWHNFKLERLAGESISEHYYIPKMKEWKFEDDKQAAEVGELYGLYSNVTVEKVAHYIRQKEYEYGSDKRQTAYERKRERVGRLMESVPAVPDDFREWWLSVCKHPKNLEYAFWNKERDDYSCTACGKTHKIAGAKHRKEYLCKRTGKTIVAIRRQQEISFTDYAMILSDVNEDWVAERLFKVETTFYNGKKTVCPEETIRVMLSRKGKKTKIYYRQYFENYYGYFYRGLNGEWWDTNPANKRWSSAYMYPVVADLSGTSCAGLKVKEMAAAGERLNWNGLLYYADHVGCFEYLLKMGLTRMAREESEKLDVWNGYRDRLDGIHTEINVFGENAEEILGINMQRIHRLRSINGGWLTLKWMKMEESSGKKISGEALELAEQKKIDAGYYGFIMNRMSPEKIIHYVERMRKEYPSDDFLSRDWKDYLSMALRLKMDVMDPIVFKPRNLKQRHDQCIEEIRKLGDDEWICEINAKYPEIDSICMSIQDKYAYADDKFTMIVPRGIRDIVEDGRQLHHCSASSERYFERINRKECYLLFLRKNEDLSKAWYTIEIQPDGTVRQKRTAYNRQDDIEEVMRFLKEWQKVIKRRLTGEDLELGRQSSIQREIEQMELLQKGDTKSMQVWQELEKDYLKNEEEIQAAI